MKKIDIYDNWINEKANRALSDLTKLLTTYPKLKTNKDFLESYRNLLKIFFYFCEIDYKEKNEIYLFVLNYGNEAYELVNDYFFNVHNGRCISEVQSYFEDMKNYNSLVAIVKSRNVKLLNNAEFLLKIIPYKKYILDQMYSDLLIIKENKKYDSFFDKYAELKMKRKLTKKEIDFIKFLDYLKVTYSKAESIA